MNPINSIIAETYANIDKAYNPYNDLSVLIVLNTNGTIEKKVIGSVVEHVEFKHVYKGCEESIAINKLSEELEKSIRGKGETIHFPKPLIEYKPIVRFPQLPPTIVLV